MKIFWLITLSLLSIFSACSTENISSTASSRLIDDLYDSLYANSLYAYVLPRSAVNIPTPQTLFRLIPDTLRGVRYTRFEESGNSGGSASRSDYLSFGFLYGVASDTIVVAKIFHNSPAEKSGLRAGDRIYAISRGNDHFYLNGDPLVFEAVTASIIATYQFYVLREGEPSIISIRKTYRGEPTSYGIYLSQDIAYIRLSTFMDNSTSDKFLSSLKDTEDARVTIVDMRGNGGGLVSECLEIAGYFIGPSKKVANLEYFDRGRLFKEDLSTPKDAEKVVGDRDFVILVDEGSASSSELLMLPLIYHKNIPVVGETTYGKAIGQRAPIKFYSDEGGFIGEAHITIARFTGVDGQVYERVGLSPDYEVAESYKDGRDAQLDKAISIAENYFLKQRGEGAPINHFYGQQRSSGDLPVYEFLSKDEFR